jgi:hypothetical protein
MPAGHTIRTLSVVRAFLRQPARKIRGKCLMTNP